MNVGHVQGGTHAGWKRLKQPTEWQHNCDPLCHTSIYDAAMNGVKDVVVTLTSYSCPDCGARRPKP